MVCDEVVVGEVYSTVCMMREWKEMYAEGVECSCEWMEGWCMMSGGKLVHDEGVEADV